MCSRDDGTVFQLANGERIRAMSLRVVQNKVLQAEALYQFRNAFMTGSKEVAAEIGRCVGNAFNGTRLRPTTQSITRFKEEEIKVFNTIL